MAEWEGGRGGREREEVGGGKGEEENSPTKYSAIVGDSIVHFQYLIDQQKLEDLKNTIRELTL